MSGAGRSGAPLLPGVAAAGLRQVRLDGTLGDFRRAARALLAEGVPPAQVAFADARDGAGSLPLGAALPAAPEARTAATPPVGAAALAARTSPVDAAPTAPEGPPLAPLLVSRELLSLFEAAAHHRDPGRWALLYRLLARLRAAPRLLEDAVDEDVRRLRRMAQAVRRDEHKMHAFVRFRRVAEGADLGGALGAGLDAGGGEGRGAGDRYVAWHRPDHLILPLAAPFFARRFAAMRWLIVTPDGSASWDGRALSFGPGAPADPLACADPLEALWLDYYRAIFNPARLNLRATVRELPRRHWATLPEARAIPSLLQEAPARAAEQVAAAAAAAAFGAQVPAGADLPALRIAAARCQGCELAGPRGGCGAGAGEPPGGLRAVFGEGAADAPLCLIGEQPGDEEDRSGRPFVGPAGQLLRAQLAAAGVDAARCYLTNAVKHFRHELRGELRLHRRPGAAHVAACRPWLEAELAALRPRVLVCLGTTAARALLGAGPRPPLGELLPTPWGEALLCTHHPAAALRAPDAAARARIEEELRRHLALAGRRATAPAPWSR